MGRGSFARNALNVPKKGVVADLARREECTKERDDAHEAGAKDQAEYDKQLLTLSAGFLAFSLAFIKDIVPLQRAIILWVLYLSLTLVGICMLLVLFSYQFSIAGNAKGKAYWESEISELDREEVKAVKAKYPYSHAKWLTRINWATGILFALGVISLISFVVLNLEHQRTIINEESIVSHQDQKVPMPGTGLKMPRPQGKPGGNSVQPQPEKTR